MDIKSFFLEDLQNQKDGYIAMIRNNDLSEDEKKVVNQKIDEIDARIERAKAVESDNTAALEKALKEMNSKFDAVKDKLNQKGVKIEGVTSGDYLKTQNAVHDFAECLRNCSQENKLSDLWGAKLSQNAISFDDATELALFPAPVATYITDSWQREAGEILREFNFVGAFKLPVVMNPDDQDTLTARAKGHAKGTKKSEQNLALTSFVIDTQYVYKIQTVYKKMEFTDDGALIRYVVDELMTQWFYEVLRAVLVGDGRATTSPDHIEAIVPIYSNANAYAAGQPDVDETVLEYMMDKVIAPIENGNNDIMLFVSRDDYQAMRKFSNGTGATPTYLNERQLAEAMGLRRIVVTDYLSAAGGENVRAIAVHASKYTLIGSLNPDFTSWEEPWDNNRAYRVEMLIGGNLTGLNGASYAMGQEPR